MKLNKSENIKKLKQDKMKEIENLENIILELESWEVGIQIKKSTLKKVGKIDDKEQCDTIVKLLKNNISLMKAVKPDEHKLYLSDIVEIEKPQFGSNNLILAPVGSGKTTLIEKVLLKGQKGKILFLTSNTSLKDSTCPDDNDLRKEIGNRMYTTKNSSRFGDTEYDIHVMNYAEFGLKIRMFEDFANEMTQIYCDEIHSLPNYQSFNNSPELLVAIRYLFKKHEDKDIYYFTATREYLDIYAKKEPEFFRYVKIFDYLKHPDIKQYMALSEYRITRIEQIREHLKSRKKSFDYFGYKCLAYNKTISGQMKIEELAKEEGFEPISLWSINNLDVPMNEEQLRVRNYLLQYGEIPEPYNFLIINSAMQEGWNLTDDLIKLAIMNTTNETEKIQALGRYRNDIDILIYKIDKEELKKEEVFIKVDLDEEYLNKSLTADMKSELCLKLNIVNPYGRIEKWTTVSKRLKQQGYLIENKHETINGKKCRVSIISR